MTISFLSEAAIYVIGHFAAHVRLLAIEIALRGRRQSDPLRSSRHNIATIAARSPLREAFRPAQYKQLYLDQGLTTRALSTASRLIKQPGKTLKWVQDFRKHAWKDERMTTRHRHLGVESVLSHNYRHHSSPSQ